MRTKFLNGLFVIMLAFMCVGCGTKNTTTEIEESKLEQEVEVLEETEESTSVQESETAEVIEEPTIETEINEEVVAETETAIEETTEITTETEEPIQEQESEQVPEPEPQAVYTYTDMSATMYATQTVNVRNLPSTDGEKIGSLSTNQEISIKAQCNESGWYMFDYNGQTAFVSNNYVSTEKVEVQQTTNSNSGGGNSLANHFGVSIPFTAIGDYYSVSGYSNRLLLWNSSTSFNPDSNYIGDFYDGTQVTISDLTGSKNDCMAYVTLPDGRSGWVQFSYNGYNYFKW